LVLNLRAMKEKLLKIYNYLEENIVVIVVSLGIFISPFIVDYATLPKGYELPKVHFLVAISAVVIFLGVIKYFENIYKKKKFIFGKDSAVFLVLVILFIISSLVSPHYTTSIFGNSFREQGLITHLLIVGMAYVLYKSVNKKNFHLLALSFIGSSVIQAGIGYTQVINLAQSDPKSLLDGLWINGTFGQANFFSGRLLLGLIFLAYYIGKSLRFRFQSLVKVFFILCSFFITGALLLSLSVWAIVTAAAAFVVILLYELLPKKAFLGIFIIAAAASSAFGIYYITTDTAQNLRIEIWKAIANIMFNNFNIKNTPFGYGFDTLGEVFRDFRQFPTVLIDRAHNFFFDILIQTGVGGLAVVLFIILKPVTVLLRKVYDRKFMFAFFALFFWLFRSFVHESGIVNMVDFLVVLAMSLALMKGGPKVEANVELNLTEVKKFEEAMMEKIGEAEGVPELTQAKE